MSSVWDNPPAPVLPPSLPPIPAHVIVSADGEPLIPNPTVPTGRDLLKVTAASFLTNIAIGFVYGAVMAMVHFISHGKPLAGTETMSHPWAMTGVSIACSGVLMWILWYIACRKHHRAFREAFAIYPVTPARALSSALLGFVLALFAAFFLGIMRQNGLTNTDDSPMGKMLVQPGALLPFALMALLLPIPEELFFRGFALPILGMAWGATAAALVTITWFTLSHASQLGGDLAALLPISLMAVAVTIQRLWSHSLVPAIITHWVYNLFIVLLMILATYAQTQR